MCMFKFLIALAKLPSIEIVLIYTPTNNVWQRLFLRNYCLKQTFSDLRYSVKGSNFHFFYYEWDWIAFLDHKTYLNSLFWEFICTCVLGIFFFFYWLFGFSKIICRPFLLQCFCNINWFCRGRERETETLICCFTYLCVHWLILVCALPRDQTCNLGILEWYSNQLSYPARPRYFLIVGKLVPYDLLLILFSHIVICFLTKFIGGFFPCRNRVFLM